MKPGSFQISPPTSGGVLEVDEECGAPLLLKPHQRRTDLFTANRTKQSNGKLYESSPASAGIAQQRRSIPAERVKELFVPLHTISQQRRTSSVSTVERAHKTTDSLTNNSKYTDVPLNLLPSEDKGYSSDHEQRTLKPANTTDVVLVNSLGPRKKAWQLVIGTLGIYSAYLYYGYVQEDLFRYRDEADVGFTFVWFLQALESAATIVIGYAGRKLYGGRDDLPVTPFFKSGVSQLAAKALMNMSLAAGLSFPVMTLAKSSKIVPVMIGQLIIGGASYSIRDYIFVSLIACGTALVSVGQKNEHIPEGSDTLPGIALICLSLAADGFTGGLQKKLKRVTASMAPTAYDFLYYSHLAQCAAALLLSCATSQLWMAPAYLVANPAVWWCVLASCICSTVGQCFVFYVISCFDPLVCTTITTTRKMLTVILSIGFKGHELNGAGFLGLGLAISALLVEVRGKVKRYHDSSGDSSDNVPLLVKSNDENEDHIEVLIEKNLDTTGYRGGSAH